MINAEFIRNDQLDIVSFQISGHAEYDDPGKDIVCSAVTALTFSTINSIETFLDIPFNYQVDNEQGGYLQASFDEALDDQASQLLLNHLLLGLEGIQEEYPDYIQLNLISK